MLHPGKFFKRAVKWYLEMAAKTDAFRQTGACYIIQDYTQEEN